MEASVPLPGQQKEEQAMEKVVRVLYDVGGPPSAPLGVSLQQRGERGTDDLAGCLYNPVQLMFLQSLAVPEPGGETICYDSLNGASVKVVR